MFNHNWLIWPTALLVWLLICEHNLGINGQSENAIGAHREFQKTSFSCVGRPSGYYADIETGCQVYHMCDGLGRQFSYSCPNTTLFQQRMLICDHWYMVNCSKAESDYAANLLIGQRDKPFVNDEENHLRTPRPDLLDRPYAADYLGESFRNQYKTIPPFQNRILDADKQKTNLKTNNDLSGPQIPPGQQRWKIPPPSRLILPPAYEPTIEIDPRNNQQNNQRSTAPPYAPKIATTAFTQYRSSYSTPSTTTTTTTRRPYTAPSPAPTIKQSFFDNAALHQRHDEHDDLGTSHSTRYNTSADFNSAEIPAKPAFKVSFSSGTNNFKSTPKPLSKNTIKVPSKFYEPPVLYPIYNENDTLATYSTTKKPFSISTAAPFTTSSTRFLTTTTKQLSTTTRPITRPTTVAGKPFSVSLFSSTPVASKPQITQNSDRFDLFKFTKQDARTPTPAQGFKAPTPRPPVSTTKTPIPSTNRLNIPTPFIANNGKNKVFAELPANDLLPPFPEFPEHDTATTQGPPIYYQWKIPSNGLEPPKLDPPYGVDGREYPDTVIDYNTISNGNGNADGFLPSQTFGVDQQSSNGFIQKFSTSTTTTRSPTVRVIKQDSAKVAPATTDIFQIRKELSVPDYAFPLENIGRTGYLSQDTFNSFQLKIPDRRSDEEAEHLHWFGENPKCPQCHPSYVVPGTCEPCFRR